MTGLLRRTLAVAFALSVTSAILATPARSAEEALPYPDWSEFELLKIIKLITQDPKSGSHEQDVWWVLLDGAAYLRTHDTRWLANLRREPNAKVRVKQQTYGVRAEEVPGHKTRKRVEQALREGYGRLKRLRSKTPGPPTIVRLGRRP